ncbi:ferritin, heavy subunit-like [Mobula birostris]|uniref:ferritin, heavy subunit-like n=1 Tax=Mobula birostris TaxID=1983395 RepID=UPI003B28D86E
MASQMCQNFQKECEDAVNRQINMELYSSYAYLSVSSYVDRDDISVHHFSKFFSKQSYEEQQCAERWMEFQNLRGGRIVLEGIRKPEKDKWSNGLEAMQRPLQMEKDVNLSLLDPHKLSNQHGDPHMCDFLERNYLDEQVKIIQEIMDQ